MHVHVVVEPLIGDLSIHFTQYCRGCKREEKSQSAPKGGAGGEYPTAEGRDSWVFLFV